MVVVVVVLVELVLDVEVDDVLVLDEVEVEMSVVDAGSVVFVTCVVVTAWLALGGPVAVSSSPPPDRTTIAMRTTDMAAMAATIVPQGTSR